MPNKNEFESKLDTTDVSDAERSTANEKNSLDKALAELSNLIKPLTQDLQSIRHFEYLLLLWAPFHIFPVDPIPTSYSSKEGGIIIPLSNGWQIIDYGYVISISPGENYGTYCTGKLIEAVKEMMFIAASRDVIKIGISGHEIAKRVAWMESLAYPLTITNYSPSLEDVRKYEIIHNVSSKEELTLGKDELDKRPE